MYKTIKLLNLLVDFTPREDRELIENLISTLEFSYVAVSWPDCQYYMNEEWFQDEAILDAESKVSDSTYLIPINRLIK